MFIDYLTKWRPAEDQTTTTVARLFVEEFIPRHGVPCLLLFDRGKSFLSHLMKDICTLIGTQKVNTTAYHPQTDGLVELFNCTLIDMLAKTTAKQGTDWDQRLPYVLFAYRSSLQESTKESPFYLLYGRDPRLPTEHILTPPGDRSTHDLDDYKSELIVRMAEAWKLARSQVEKAQQWQKKQHNRLSSDAEFHMGDRVYVYMPAEKRGKAYKFARPFRGPYCVTALYDNGVDVQLVDKPQFGTIRVVLNRVRRSLESRRKTKTQNTPSSECQGCWSGRLRPRPSGTMYREDGDV